MCFPLDHRTKQTRTFWFYHNTYFSNGNIHGTSNEFELKLLGIPIRLVLKWQITYLRTPYLNISLCYVISKYKRTMKSLFSKENVSLSPKTLHSISGHVSPTGSIFWEKIISSLNWKKILRFFLILKCTDYLESHKQLHLLTKKFSMTIRPCVKQGRKLKSLLWEFSIWEQ